MTFADKIHYMIDLATQYAIARRLDVDCYIDGIMTFGDDKDPEPLVDTLIKYHKDWLR